MRLTPGDPVQIQHLQDQIDRLLDQDWKGRDAEDLARRLRRLRLRMTVLVTAYQARMRELQRARSKAS